MYWGEGCDAKNQAHDAKNQAHGPRKELLEEEMKKLRESLAKFKQQAAATNQQPGRKKRKNAGPPQSSTRRCVRISVCVGVCARACLYIFPCAVSVGMYVYVYRSSMPVLILISSFAKNKRAIYRIIYIYIYITSLLFVTYRSKRQCVLRRYDGTDAEAEAEADKKIWPQLRKFLSQVIDTIVDKLFNRGTDKYVWFGGTILCSRKGCRSQPCHCDIPSTYGSGRKEIYSCLYALDPRTVLNFCGIDVTTMNNIGGVTVQVREGELIIFTGDTYHGGGAYLLDDNIRLFFKVIKADKLSEYRDFLFNAKKQQEGLDVMRNCGCGFWGECGLDAAGSEGDDGEGDDGDGEGDDGEGDDE